MKPAGQPRTFNTWAFIGVFAALGALGIHLFIGGDQQTETEVVPTKQTTVETSAPPDDEQAADGSAGSGSAGSGSTTTAGTEPADATAGDHDADPTGGTASGAGAGAGAVGLPDGVTHQRSGTSNSYVFTPPASLAGVPSAELGIQIAAASLSAGDGRLLLTVRCTASAEEFLAQVSVDEGTQVITVVPVVLVPPAGAPCPANAPGRTVELPLDEPLGGRTLRLAPAGSPLPGSTPIPG